jgi:hypothetical protein
MPSGSFNQIQEVTNDRPALSGLIAMQIGHAKAG